MLLVKGYSENDIKHSNSILLRDYQNNLLGTTDPSGETLLTEIYPIPCKDYNIWGNGKEDLYDKIIPQYKSKADYRKKVFPKRIKIFQQIINSNNFSAKAIVCYGKAGWPEFKKFFKSFGVNFKNSEKLGQNCMIGILNNNVKVILTPFLGNGKMSYTTLNNIKDVITETTLDKSN
jgi:hypothetical protein